MNKKTNTKNGLVPMVVTTSHRGVFFGYGVPSDTPTIRLERPRMIVYWSADTRSVVGLAANGPTAACRISPEALAITLRDVTAVIEVSATAEKRFHEAPWS